MHPDDFTLFMIAYIKSMTDTPFVVSAAWLHEHLNDSQVVIVDCRFSLADPELGRQQYLTNHIQGAHYLDLNKDLSATVGRHGVQHQLINASELENKLE